MFPFLLNVGLLIKWFVIEDLWFSPSFDYFVFRARNFDWLIKLVFYLTSWFWIVALDVMVMCVLLFTINNRRCVSFMAISRRYTSLIIFFYLNSIFCFLSICLLKLRRPIFISLELLEIVGLFLRSGYVWKFELFGIFSIFLRINLW